MIELLVWLLAFFIGSIPCGALIAKMKNVQIQKHGSGNIGASNVTRIVGKKAGLVTLAGDSFKGLFSVVLATKILHEPTFVAITGFIVCAGHVFSLFLNFKGGKGVATGLGVFIYLMPQATLCSVVVFVLTLTTGYISVGSILASITLPLAGLWFEMHKSYILASVAVALMIIQKHRGNIRRLLQGTENKFKKK